MYQFENLDNMGLICRGQSLERLPSIIDKFDHCVILNKWTRAMVEKSGNCLKGKQILHWVNHHLTSILDKGLYEELDVTKGIFWWTQRHLSQKIKDIEPAVEMQIRLLKKLYFMPDRLYDNCNKMTNSGPMSLLFVSEVLKPKKVWIIGLDFHASPYLDGEETNFQRRRIKEGLGLELVTKFVDIVREYPNIQYELITYYSNIERLRGFSNLSVWPCRP